MRGNRLAGALVALFAALAALVPAAGAASASARLNCGQESHAFYAPAGPTFPRGTVLTLSGIVQPNTRVVWDFYKGNQSPLFGNTPFARFGTTFARSNCVVDQRDGNNTISTAPFPATTSVYVSYIRWEDGVTVLNQFYGKVFVG